jgi:hypothetical protein
MAAQAAAPRDHLRVATESFRPYWDDLLRLLACRNGHHFDVKAFCENARISTTEYDSIKRAMLDSDERPSLSFDLVDRVMVAAGMQYLVPSLYVVDERPKSLVGSPHAAPPRANRRSAQAHYRRVRIQEMWSQGLSVQGIADELATSAKSIGVAMVKMRDAGWDLPYRRPPAKHQALVSGT